MREVWSFLLFYQKSSFCCWIIINSNKNIKIFIDRLCFSLSLFFFPFFPLLFFSKWIHHVFFCVVFSCHIEKKVWRLIKKQNFSQMVVSWWSFFKKKLKLFEKRKFKQILSNYIFFVVFVFIKGKENYEESWF